jgi:hypothetical protein
MGDDERGDAGERFARERAGRMGGDVELAAGEQVGGAAKRGVAGVGGLDRGGDLGADRPRLRVRLVEQDRGELRMVDHRRFGR